jgi:hypothetical protein
LYCVQSQPTFRRNISPPSSASKNKPRKKPVWERKVLPKIFGALCEQGEWLIRENEEVYKLYGELQLVAEVKKRRLQYVSHVVRLEEDRVTKKILDQHPGDRRKPGRPRKRWLDDVTKDLEVLGIRGWRRRPLDRKNGRNL